MLLASLCECTRLLSHIQLFATPQTVARQASLSVEFSQQEYWSGLPIPPPGKLPNPGIEPTSPETPASADGLFTTEPPGNPVLALTAQQNESAIHIHMSPSFQISLPFRIPQCVSSLEERKADTSLKKNYNNAPNLSMKGSLLKQN